MYEELRRQKYLEDLTDYELSICVEIDNCYRYDKNIQEYVYDGKGLDNLFDRIGKERGNKISEVAYNKLRSRITGIAMTYDRNEHDKKEAEELARKQKEWREKYPPKK